MSIRDCLYRGDGTDRMVLRAYHRGRLQAQLLVQAHDRARGEPLLLCVNRDAAGSLVLLIEGRHDLRTNGPPALTLAQVRKMVHHRVRLTVLCRFSNPNPSLGLSRG